MQVIGQLAPTAVREAPLREKTEADSLNVSTYAKTSWLSRTVRSLKLLSMARTVSLPA
jgi:hypothetical protein